MYQITLSNKRDVQNLKKKLRDACDAHGVRLGSNEKKIEAILSSMLSVRDYNTLLGLACNQSQQDDDQAIHEIEKQTSPIIGFMEDGRNSVAFIQSGKPKSAVIAPMLSIEAAIQVLPSFQSGKPKSTVIAPILNIEAAIQQSGDKSRASLSMELSEPNNKRK